MVKLDLRQKHTCLICVKTTQLINKLIQQLMCVKRFSIKMKGEYILWRKPKLRQHVIQYNILSLHVWTFVVAWQSEDIRIWVWFYYRAHFNWFSVLRWRVPRRHCYSTTSWNTSSQFNCPRKSHSSATPDQLFTAKGLWLEGVGLAPRLYLWSKKCTNLIDDYNV